ncbi:MAG: hypothetical protein D6835_04865 [Candidatus Thermofonsia bacterium]|nr:MAG: hypothetical protein D6835_04865 [Candidatus Thermofonsia bacterium]
MQIEVISISTQLLHSDILNTNAAFVSRVLKEQNLPLTCKVTVGEDLPMVTNVLQSALGRADVVLVIGGSTEGSGREGGGREGGGCLLCQAVSQLLQRPLNDKGFLADAVSHTDADNRFLGWWLEDNGRLIVGLPGDRREMAYFLETKVLPHLHHHFNEPRPQWLLLRTVGVMESTLKDELSDLMINPQYHISFDSFAGQTSIRVNIDDSAHDAPVLLSSVRSTLHNRLGDHIYGEGDVRLEDVVLEKLMQSGYRLALAECYTGLSLMHILESIPQASGRFMSTLTSTATELANYLNLQAELLDLDLTRWCRLAAEKMLAEMEADLALLIYNNVTQGGVQVLVTLASPFGVSVTQRSFGGHPTHINQWACTLGLAHLRRWLIVHA